MNSWKYSNLQAGLPKKNFTRDDQIKICFKNIFKYFSKFTSNLSRNKLRFFCVIFTHNRINLTQIGGEITLKIDKNFIDLRRHFFKLIGENQKIIEFVCFDKNYLKKISWIRNLVCSGYARNSEKKMCSTDLGFENTKYLKYNLFLIFRAIILLFKKVQ